MSDSILVLHAGSPCVKFQLFTAGADEALVFAAGIGEHSAPIRARVCNRLLRLGLEIDHDANARGERRIGSPMPGSPPTSYRPTRSA
ncbi:hypothetical protein [Benzoatithermus flavus]|uniref:Uncharacterized protein n=1 Tax=Benzoatithermus flavus TaxID=3108223 RepID=A0ABU8XQ63_9PROT